jgi:SAM-dependent methyltransferase
MSGMDEKFLDKVYSARTPEETRDLYDAWSASYDAEVNGNGYATPGRCAAALAAHVHDLSAPILDFGCGTGLSGVALKLAGFETIDGVDLSADMLDGAREKGVYRSLSQIEPGVAPSSDYATVAAIGVIGAGAAPLATFDLLMHALPTGGKLTLSFNDHVLSDPAYEGRISEWTDCAAARLLFREHGDHLPGIDVKSTVYVIEKL